ncbi:two component transcriptional regulator, winged helix family [Shewanella halifaxensis HAW-EB4]|uniref:Two component transcriptional regulator, winged helix family n=1 Tax=Shewanella halifaxensis (strain HAW-EB4) TaxID=458817 RepID=B0TV68_SHEHH|nr:response regulator [Shewanella halifaxensis]ABZ75506.1 two component transcriptional regulator, winged helix family [Shewanella halifaxensis HAW-EB4]
MTNSQSTHRVLLVEDDIRLANLIVDFLKSHGMHVEVERRGDTVLTRLINYKPDIILLDIMLPGMDGLTLCEKLPDYFAGPILLMSALGSNEDQIKGLELGADDYVVKPVDPSLLVARINNLLRRQAKPAQVESHCLSFGKLSIDPHTQAIRLGETEVDLTSHEFELLWLLASQAGQVMSRQYIYQYLLNIDFDGKDRKIDVRISRLRKKLGDNIETPFRIKTVWGQGYLFAPEAWNN